MNPKNRVMEPKSQVAVEAQDEQEWELSDEELDREALPSPRGLGYSAMLCQATQATRGGCANG